MSLVPGYTVTSPTEQFTWEKIRLMFVNGSASIADQSEITPGVITVSPTAPTGKTGDGWFDTSLGSGYGMLRIFDGSDWKNIAGGFLGINTGLAVAVGAPMKLDSATVTAQTGARVAVTKTKAPAAGVVQTDRMFGVAGSSMANGEIGVVLTRGKVKIAKDTVNITAGDPVVASSVTDGQGSTNAVGSWGTPFGSCSPGVWLETSSAAAGTLVTAYLTGETLASWAAYKSAPATLLNEVAPSALATWQTAVSWSASPAGTVAHLVNVRLKGTAAVTNGQFIFGMRANGSSLTIDTGASFLSAWADDSAANAREGLRGQLIVPMGTTDNKFQWYVDTGTTLTAAQMSVLLFEVGAMVGGQVV